MRLAALIPLIAAAAPVVAAGSDDDTPPKPTRTVTECAEGQIFDKATQSCIDADAQSFNDDRRYDAVRELAYAGAYDRALRVIAAADRPDDARFLNYRGFIARKTGDMDAAVAFYDAALAADPDHLLARSYMGQGLAAKGDRDGAEAQLREIAARGGRGTWAYASLKLALGGRPASY